MGNDVWIDKPRIPGRTTMPTRHRRKFSREVLFSSSPPSQTPSEVDGTFNLPFLAAATCACACTRVCGSICISLCCLFLSPYATSVRAENRAPSSIYAFIKLEGSQSLWVVEDRAHHRPEVGVVGSRPRTRMGRWKRERWKRARWRRARRRRRRRVLRGWWESERGCFSTTSCSRHPQTPLGPGVREGASEGEKRERTAPNSYRLLRASSSVFLISKQG